MSRDNTTTIVGNLTRDPELKYLDSGLAVCNLGVAWNPPPAQDGTEKDPSFFNVACFRDLAENVAESLSKGDRVVVNGHFTSRQYESKTFVDSDGNPAKQTAVELVADDVAPSLRWATAKTTRNERSGGGAEKAMAQAAAAGATVPSHEPF